MKITIKNLQNKIPINPRVITRISKQVLKEEKVRSNCELSFVFVDDKFIKPLNKKYLHVNRPTDVLTFNFDSNIKQNKYLGEIIISCETVSRNAKNYANSVNKELIFCIIHGILHLLGYGDETRAARGKMFDKQYQILNKLKNRDTSHFLNI